MKISRVTAGSIQLPYVEGVYRMSGDRITTGMDAVVVRLVTDDGLVGIGESGTVGVTFDAQHLPGQTINHVEGPTPRDGSVLRPQAEAPGLGLTLREDVLGEPFLDVRA